MTPFQRLTESVTIRFNKQIRLSCSKLFETLNLNNLWYYKLTQAGSYSYLGSDIGTSTYFSEEKFYLKYPLYRHPKYFSPGILFLNALPDPDEMFSCLTNKFSSFNQMVILEKNPESIEAFGFASSLEGEAQLQRVVNELPLLQQFTRYFRNENKEIFSKLEGNQVNLALEEQSLFLEDPFKSAYAINKTSILKEMGYDYKLIPSEKKLIMLLLFGLSAREISEQIYRSKRTVEHHIERIKDKMYCSSKSELIQKGRELEKLGLLGGEAPLCL